MSNLLTRIVTNCPIANMERKTIVTNSNANNTREKMTMMMTMTTMIIGKSITRVTTRNTKMKSTAKRNMKIVTKSGIRKHKNIGQNRNLNRFAIYQRFKNVVILNLGSILILQALLGILLMLFTLKSIEFKCIL